ncbi:hypothetical protein ATANTOWER_004083 [Ataeniobius toweri]|uniref:Uncharacterized protein n=1 Tax=Ataeniobius toweri TaxID=208326 RepID=A0ABU7CE48_9TELE|nr:hypothetical protein [Ataeniobius toweri]
MMQWNVQKSGNRSSALHSPTRPFEDPSIAGAPSVAIAVNFENCKLAFSTTVMSVSFRSMPWVLSFNGTISSNSSLIAQSSETVLTNTANCGLSWMSVDSSKSMLKYRDFSRSPDSCDSNDVLMSDILCSTVCLESCRPETERFK